jgi:hypothetical protein
VIRKNHGPISSGLYHESYSLAPFFPWPIHSFFSCFIPKTYVLGCRCCIPFSWNHKAFYIGILRLALHFSASSSFSSIDFLQQVCSIYTTKWHGSGDPPPSSCSCFCLLYSLQRLMPILKNMIEERYRKVARSVVAAIQINVAMTRVVTWWEARKEEG